ncbi:hypothetical protein AN944_02637 [Shewanella sp. P1-14-1]|nr:hypothetical protein AN944_02637 [Shewanella sp. P1-14-1]
MVIHSSSVVKLKKNIIKTVVNLSDLDSLRLVKRISVFPSPLR